MDEMESNSGAVASLSKKLLCEPVAKKNASALINITIVQQLKDFSTKSLPRNEKLTIRIAVKVRVYIDDMPKVLKIVWLAAEQTTAIIMISNRIKHIS